MMNDNKINPGETDVNGGSAQPLLRNILDKRQFSTRRFFLQWEWMLIIVFIGVNVLNASLSSDYLVFDSLMSAIQIFCDKAILVFPMMLVLLIGEIDISIASTMALSATVMGVAFKSGIPLPAAIAIALIVGLACGAFNGIILTLFPELSSMIVTLGTQILFRGIASIILKDGAVGGFSKWFNYFGWGNVGRIPFILLVFFLLALIFAYMIHFTTFGRQLYAMGNNSVTSSYSGLRVGRNRIIVFAVMGLFAAISAVFLSSKMGSVRSSIARGYELDIIAMVVLGGVSNNGGKGRVFGVVLATFIVGLLRHGLGIINVPSQVIMIIIGALLIVAVTIPRLRESVGSTRWFKNLTNGISGLKATKK